MTATKPEVLNEGEWSVLRFEATAVSLPMILKLGAHHGAWPLPKDRSTCPCCGTPKPEQIGTGPGLRQEGNAQ